MYRPLIASTLLAAVTAHASEGELLTRDAILRHVVGNTIHFAGAGDELYQYLDPSGAIRIESTAHGKFAARWRFFDDQTFCFESADPMSSGCVGIQVNGGQITFVRRDGVVEGPFELQAGNPRHL